MVKTIIVCRHAEFFKVFGIGSRIRIVEQLKPRKALEVKVMAEALGITPSAVSKNLKALRYAGLVHNERRGYLLPDEIDHAALSK
jgi:DNA-binding transcriptional ArsR family regulator